jgi:hypothetical protein
MRAVNEICRKFDMQPTALALSLPAERAGNKSAAKIAITPITTRSSINVKPLVEGLALEPLSHATLIVKLIFNVKPLQRERQPKGKKKSPGKNRVLSSTLFIHFTNL